MCEAAVYMIRNNKEELILESVDTLECEGVQIRLVDIFGEKRRVEGRIKSLALVDHKIIIEPL